MTFTPLGDSKVRRVGLSGVSSWARRPRTQRGLAALALGLVPLAPWFITVSPATAMAGSSAETTAHYVVVELKDDGSVAVVHSQIVHIRGPLTSLSPAQMKTRLAVANYRTKVVAFTLRDKAGTVLYQNTVNIPAWLRGEFHKQVPPGSNESNIDGHFFPLQPNAFVVRVPVIPATTLELQSELIAPATSFELDALTAQPSFAAAPVAAASPLPGWNNGDPANRVDMLIVSEGYTLAQQSQFQSDALQLANNFFTLTPYYEYRNYMNVSTLFVASAQSGADQPPYSASCTQYARAQTCCSDPTASGAGSVFVDTAFDATYCSLNTERLLTVDTGKVLAAAAAEPNWDKIIVLVNAPTYGGSGGPVAVVSTHALSVEIAQHEYGHSFTLLADEYAAPFPGFPPCSDVNPSLHLCERNVTDQTTRALIKWNRWIAPSLPIPSLAPPPTATDAGLWQGARYLNTMYRQGYDCIMRSLGMPFCDVASEAYALRLYEGGWGIPASGIDNIEPGSESPAPGSVSVPATGTTFSANVLGPVTAPDLTATWYVDGVVASTAAVPSGSTVSYDFIPPPGLHTLSLEVIDNSPVIHPTLRASLASNRSWSISVPTATPTVRQPSPTPSATPTATAAKTPTRTPTTSAVACVGDCNHDHSITVDEVLTMVTIALGNLPTSACAAGDANGDGQITVDEILTAVDKALNGCA